MVLLLCSWGNYVTYVCLANFGPASLLPLFQSPQAWPKVMISCLVDQSSGVPIFAI